MKTYTDPITAISHSIEHVHQAVVICDDVWATLDSLQRHPELDDVEYCSADDELDVWGEKDGHEWRIVLRAVPTARLLNEQHLGTDASPEEARRMAAYLTAKGYPTEYTAISPLRSTLDSIPESVWQSALHHICAPPADQAPPTWAQILQRPIHDQLDLEVTGARRGMKPGRTATVSPLAHARGAD
jgi:hypothetical protein